MKGRVKGEEQGKTVITYAGKKFITNQHLASLLKKEQDNSQLKEINFNDNSIDDEGANFLAKFIGRNPHLQIIRLANNKITDEGAQALADALVGSNITLLEMSGNPIANPRLFNHIANIQQQNYLKQHQSSEVSGRSLTSTDSESTSSETDTDSTSYSATSSGHTSLSISTTISPSGQPYIVDDQGQISTSCHIAYEELTNQKYIGSGGFGAVFKGEYGNRAVAIKKLNVFNEKALDEFKREVSIMARIRSPFIVFFHGACFEPSHYCLVTDYAAKGSLSHVLENESGLSWEIRYPMAIDISYGLEYLHRNYIVHADLKPDNIVVDEAYHPKIMDFGCSKMKPRVSMKTIGPIQAGTLRWMAPELFESDKVPTTRASDMYSFGMTLWSLCSFRHPFAGMGEVQAVQHVYHQNGREEILEDTPEEMAIVIRQCWQKEPSERPQIEEAVTILKEGGRRYTLFGAITTHLDKDNDKGKGKEKEKEKEKNPSSSMPKNY